jgi:hypothetical protein
MGQKEHANMGFSFLYGVVRSEFGTWWRVTDGN